MQTAWLEDYLALRELGSFTAAAERRNASQPAFSRRIQALEEWLGVTLVDRSCRPPAFTPLALENDQEIRNLLNHIQDLKSRLRGEENRGLRLRIAVQHSLSLSLLPQMLAHHRSRGIQPSYWLHCGDRADCIDMMFRDKVEVLVCYETARLLADVPATLAERRVLGSDRLVLVAHAEEAAGIIASRRLPLLTYPQMNFFAQAAWDDVMPALSLDFEIETVCVSGFSGALKEMALARVGAAWLPESMARSELETGRLRLVDGERASCHLDVSCYTRSSGVSDDQKSTLATLLEFPL